MGKSGNPAKAALFTEEERAVQQIRAGIEQGKGAVVTLTPDTKVTINSTNPDEAEFIARIIIENVNYAGEEKVSSLFGMFMLYFGYLGIDDEKLNQRIIKALKQELKKHEEYSEWNKVPLHPSFANEPKPVKSRW